ncbi:YbaB/EbfC family nucleoid-associated protein [Enterococcus sp. PF-2]|uniref:YbaB/EbfC family nucleoid-associated protein n=1 Tax=unclassified Enterococcus TaxID=2608891 RepID=UPI00111F4322|nr:MULTISPECIES: YbaB/EbfC family nucleoid-associated protein [unclassified Enterococcus]TPE03676.1 YbaB/EbfC family nucleoid-associated protein [Enterococcus sp. PF-3]TPE27104.1 YbaB/EbfC family nucleoid-associated protein [Enterococcus sp. PF-2]
MMRGMGNMQGMMKQMQKMQKEMMKEQEALNSKEFIGESTNGYVKATFTGDKTLQDIAINEAIVDADDVEMLQDMIILAINDGLKKIEKESEQKMGKYTRNIPGL